MNERNFDSASTTPLESISPNLVIEKNRRIVSDTVSEYTGIKEYSDQRTGDRVMTLPSISEQAQLHQELLAKHVPVFRILEADSTSLYLGVPADARSLQQSLRFVARDLEHYGHIFQQVGEVLGRCQAGGFGLPVKQLEHPVLAGIAFSTDINSSYGSNVHLIPPYGFNSETDETTEIEVLRDELIESGLFTSAQTQYLLNATHEGWNSVRS